MKRVGDWMQTYTSKMFYPLDPRVEDICIEDIAHALSQQCRYASHCHRFYSVAEHSVRVSWFSKCHPLAGLLHDATEAYIVDVPRPLKRSVGMEGYRDIEARVAAVIADRFGIPSLEPSCVRLADETLLATEARDLMGVPPAEWGLTADPLVTRIEPWSSYEAERQFLAAFDALADSGILAECAR